MDQIVNTVIVTLISIPRVTSYLGPFKSEHNKILNFDLVLIGEKIDMSIYPLFVSTRMKVYL